MTAKSAILLFLILLSGFDGLSQKIQRVVSLAPSVTEIIYQVEAKDKLVGCTSFCTIAKGDKIPEVGSTVDVNIEALFALQPDLVLAMKLTKTQDIEAMKKLGIRVEVMESPKNFEEICMQTLHIAKLIGAQDKAQEEVKKAREKVEEIKLLAQKNTNNKIFFQLGANPVFTVLENTFMNDYITLCNGENIASGLTKGTITRESVLVKNPDVIIIATMGGFGTEEKKVWEKYDGINAVRNHKLFLIDSEASCSPTPANFVSALEDVYRFVSKQIQ